MGFFFVLVYLVACYLRPTDLYPELALYRPMMWFALITGAIVAFDAIRMRRSIRAPQYWLLAAFMCVVLVSRLAQGWVGGAFQAVADFSVPAAVFYFVALSVTSVRRLKVLTGFLLLSFCLLSIQALKGYATGSRMFFLRQFSDEDDSFRENFNPEDQDAMESEAADLSLGVKRIRSVGFLHDPNDFAQTLLVGLALLGGMWQSGRRLRNVLCVILPGSLLLVTIYLTHSRGALVGMLALILFWIRNRWGNRLAIVGAALGAPLLVAAKLLGGSGSGAIDASSYGRINAWSEGLEMLKRQPLFGVGYNFFVDHNDLTAHNSFVLCFSELGLVGYFVWLAILVITAVQLFRFDRPPEDNNAESDDDEALRWWAGTLRYALCAFLVTAFFLSRTYVITLYLLVGMTVALQALSQESESPVESPSPRQWMTWTTAVEVLSIVAVYLMVRAGHMLGAA